ARGAWSSSSMPSATMRLRRWLTPNSTRAWTHERFVAGRSAGGAAVANRRIAASSVAAQPIVDLRHRRSTMTGASLRLAPWTSRESGINHLDGGEDQALLRDRRARV